MKILKYKKKKDKYIVTFDSEELELYEEVILNNGLLLKKEVDDSIIKKLVCENNFYECYYKALKLIKVKPRSVYEVRNKLNKEEFDSNDIEKVINKLLTQGYLNDEFYANSYLNNKLITTYHGPKRIYNDLNKMKIDHNILDNVILLYTDDIQEEKVSKIVDRMIKTNKNKSNNYLKKKIYNNLIMEGFSKKVIDKVVNSKEFNNDKDIRDKEYEKLKNKLSKKYSGVELEYKIKESMIRKGFY